MRPFTRSLLIWFANLAVGGQFIGQVASESCGQEGPREYSMPPIVAGSDAGWESGSRGSQPPCNCVQNASKENASKRAKSDPSKSHKTLFFQNDFSYLDGPNYEGWLLGDRLKNWQLPSGPSIEVGGQYRMRAHFERNMRGLGLTGVDDAFLLHRTRVYGDIRLSSRLRLFAEMIDAESNLENFGPRPIEVNRSDMLNLFADVTIDALPTCGDIVARVGRQELLFGAQRNVSPLDWANTRRNFEGGRLTLKNGQHSLDAFWVNPVSVDQTSFDAPDRDQTFSGVYSTYKSEAKASFDTFFLNYDNRTNTNDFNFSTVGARWHSGATEVMWDVEAAYQFGENTDGSTHVAGMCTIGFGKKLGAAMKPTVWLYYDWASGDDATGAGNGFHHNFPLAHKYNGFMDLFGRRNLEDVNFQISVQPTKRIKLLAWYHYFFLETASDTPYSVTMAPFNAGSVPGDAELGHEIDLLATISLGKRQSLAAGYSHFFAGEYYRTTPGVPFVGNADFFYTQWTVNF